MRIKVDACEARTTGALPAARKNALRAVGYAVDGSARAEGARMQREMQRRCGGDAAAMQRQAGGARTASW